MWRNYLKITYRNLSRNKLYAGINILGLAIGLAAAMMILLYTKDEVSYDRFHENRAQIYRIVNRWTHPDGSLKMADGSTGALPGPRFAEKIPEIATYVRVRGDFRNIRTGTEVESHQVLFADTSFFSVFTFPLVSGHSGMALRDPDAIVISEKMALKFFGTFHATGKTITIIEDGTPRPVKVTAVAKDCPLNSSIKFDLLLPMQVRAEEYANTENWFNFFQSTFVMLHPGAEASRVEAKMKQVYESEAAEAIASMAAKYDIKESATYLLQPLDDLHLSADYSAGNGLAESGNPVFSYILSGISLFILVIACINFINLTVSRSLKRAREIGLRKVVGGARRQLIAQFMGESYGLCLMAFLLAVLMVQGALPTFNELSGKALSFSYLLDVRLVMTYTVLFLLTGLMAGFYPAYVLSGYDPVKTLYSRFNLSGRNYLQKGLVIFQFSLASFLIVATLVIYAQFDYLVSKDLGYNDKNLMLVSKWNMTRTEAARFRNELLRNPGIMEVAPKNGGSWGTVALINKGQQIDFNYETVDAAFLPLIEVPLLRGRNFSASFPADSSHSVIVNEAFVRKAGWKEPLGQKVDFFSSQGGAVYEVVGVTKDYHSDPLNQKIKPQLFTMKPDNNYGVNYIRFVSGSEASVVPYVRSVFLRLFPAHSFSYTFMDEQNRNNYDTEARWKQIMLFATTLTIFISCMGLFGLATLSAERRMKEMGIRKVLGASALSVARLLSSDFFALVAVSLSIGFPVAYWVGNKWLDNYPYHVSINGWVFLLTLLGVAVLVLITVGYQSLKASLANPARTLRSE